MKLTRSIWVRCQYTYVTLWPLHRYLPIDHLHHRHQLTIHYHHHLLCHRCASLLLATLSALRCASFRFSGRDCVCVVLRTGVWAQVFNALIHGGRLLTSWRFVFALLGKLSQPFRGAAQYHLPIPSFHLLIHVSWWGSYCGGVWPLLRTSWRVPSLLFFVFCLLD